MLKVFLHGRLGESVGKEWRFNVETVPEAFAAIDANTDKFYSFLMNEENIKDRYHVHFEDKNLLTEEEISLDGGLMVGSKKELHVVPLIEGEGKIKKFVSRKSTKLGFWALVTGVALGMGARGLENIGWDKSAKLARGLSSIAYEIGIAMTIQGVIETLQDDPEPPDVAGTADPASSSSYIFQNPTNNIIQGVYVPVGYGRLRVGSNVISSSLFNSDLVKLEDDWNHSSIVEEEVSGGGGKAYRSQETAQHINTGI